MPISTLPIALLAGILLSCPAFAQAAIVIDRIEGSVLHFKAAEGVTPAPASVPDPMNTGLFDLKSIGALGGTPPYFVVSGKSCADCPADTAIYALSPLSTGGTKPSGFVYPGKILDSKTKAVVYQARAFYGQCLKTRKDDVLVLFQHERVDRRRGMQSSVLVAQPADGRLHEQLIERHLPRLNDTLKRVKAKTCWEISGRNRVMASRPLDVQLRRNAKKLNDADDDEESDEAPRENQTDRDFAVPVGG